MLPIGFGWIKFAVTRDNHKKKVVQQGNFCRKIQVGETAWWSKAPFLALSPGHYGSVASFQQRISTRWGGFRQWLLGHVTCKGILDCIWDSPYFSVLLDSAIFYFHFDQIYISKHLFCSSKNVSCNVRQQCPITFRHASAYVCVTWCFNKSWSRAVPVLSTLTWWPSRHSTLLNFERSHCWMGICPVNLCSRKEVSRQCSGYFSTRGSSS